MQRQCEQCGKTFEAQRSTKKSCSSTCRANKSKSKPPAHIGGSSPVSPELTRPVSGLVDAVRAELEVLGRLDSVIGQHALEVANRIVSAPGMNAGVASLSKELSRVMGEARSTSTAAVDPVDELQARRDAKRAAAG